MEVDRKVTRRVSEWRKDEEMWRLHKKLIIHCMCIMVSAMVSLLVMPSLWDAMTIVLTSSMPTTIQEWLDFVAKV